MICNYRRTSPVKQVKMLFASVILKDEFFPFHLCLEIRQKRNLFSANLIEQAENWYQLHKNWFFNSPFTLQDKQSNRNKMPMLQISPNCVSFLDQCVQVCNNFALYKQRFLLTTWFRQQNIRVKLYFFKTKWHKKLFLIVFLQSQ